MYNIICSGPFKKSISYILTGEKTIYKDYLSIWQEGKILTRIS